MSKGERERGRESREREGGGKEGSGRETKIEIIVHFSVQWGILQLRLEWYML